MNLTMLLIYFYSSVQNSIHIFIFKNNSNRYKAYHIMILISIVLTLISGLVPASAAAKKDPVLALRTE